MDSLPTLGTDISTYFLPTHKLSHSLHLSLTHAQPNPSLTASSTPNPALIEPEEHTYYPPTTSTQSKGKLDLYRFHPPSSSIGNAPKKAVPLVVFLYGGGLDSGEKRLRVEGVEGSGEGEEVFYKNVGRFFVKRGFHCIIPDYSLYPAAVYPTQRDEVGMVVEWARKNIEDLDGGRISIVGNSAGGIHAASYIFDSPHATHPPIHSLILLATPCSRPSNETPAQSEKYINFFGGDEQRVRELMPMGLLKRVLEGSGGKGMGEGFKTRVLIAWSERDLENVIESSKFFLVHYLQHCSSHKNNLENQMQKMFIRGHNHISLPRSLGLGGKEDAWGEEMIRWLKKD